MGVFTNVLVQNAFSNSLNRGWTNSEARNFEVDHFIYFLQKGTVESRPVLRKQIVEHPVHSLGQGVGREVLHEALRGGPPSYP